MKSKIIAILNDIRPEFDFNEPVDNFVEAGLLDSFDLVTLVTSLDEAFEISIDGTDIVPENFCNVESILNLLNKYIK
jgi:acyl carrier protein